MFVSVDIGFSHHLSTFLLNDAGGGGAMGVAYFPLSFSGYSVFQQNRGRTLVVSKPQRTHGSLCVYIDVHVCMYNLTIYAHAGYGIKG